MQTPNPDSNKPYWRPLTPADIPALLRIADTIHPALPESEAVFLERINLFPSGCLALVSNTNSNSNSNSSTRANSDEDVKDTLLGYAISHPIPFHRPPPLDTLLTVIPQDAEHNAEHNVDQYYIHDLALLPSVRGTGLAKVGVEMLLANARAKGFKTTGLVSVYGTAGFWGRFGFVGLGEGEIEGDVVLREKLGEYGEDAVFLERVN